MRKIEYGIDTFGLEKHPSSIVGKKRKTLLRIWRTQTQNIQILCIYIYTYAFSIVEDVFSPIFGGLPYFSAPGAWAKLSKFLCLLSRSLSLSLRSLRLPVPCPSLVCCSLKQTRNGYVINKHRSVNLFWFLGRLIFHFHSLNSFIILNTLIILVQWGSFMRKHSWNIRDTFGHPRILVSTGLAGRIYLQIWTKFQKDVRTWKYTTQTQLKHWMKPWWSRGIKKNILGVEGNMVLFIFSLKILDIPVMKSKFPFESTYLCLSVSSWREKVPMAANFIVPKYYIYINTYNMCESTDP